MDLEIETLLEDGFVTLEPDEFGEMRVVLTELGRIALIVREQTTSLPSG